MLKKKYRSPILMLDDGGDEVIHFGGSQGTSGDVDMYTYDPELEDLIGMYDDTDFEAMDTNHDYFISVEEFEAYNG